MLVTVEARADRMNPPHAAGPISLERLTGP
jgi:hypothetical protein